MNYSKNWMTQYEINAKAHKMIQRCIDHECPYLKRLAGGLTHNGTRMYYCAYLEISGHARIKEPENRDAQKCSHWQDKNVKNKENIFCKV